MDRVGMHLILFLVIICSFVHHTNAADGCGPMNAPGGIVGPDEKSQEQKQQMNQQQKVAADEAEALRLRQEAEAARLRAQEEKARLEKEQKMAEQRAREAAEKAAQMAREKAAQEAAEKAAAEAAAAAAAAEKEAAAKAAQKAREKAAKEAAEKAAAEEAAAKAAAAKKAAAKAAAAKEAASKKAAAEARGKSKKAEEEGEDGTTGEVASLPPGYIGPKEKFSINCEHKKPSEGALQLICPRSNQRLHITRALYGRNSTKICSKLVPPELTDVTDCGKPKRSLKLMQQACEKKKQCAIQPMNKVFGDNCPGKHKFLKVYYQCLEPGDVALPSWPKI